MQLIRKEIHELKNRLEKMPKTWRFRGRKVVPIDRWDPGDWTTLPDEYHVRVDLDLKPPHDWWSDYTALLRNLQDPYWGERLCGNCTINKAQQTQKSVDRYSWANRGDEKALNGFYKNCAPESVAEFKRTDKMRLAELRLYNETAGADNRTCATINYFKCPYGEERDD